MPQIEILHTDCMEYMAGLPDKAFDLAIVDPPYGIGYDAQAYKNSGTKYGSAAAAKSTYKCTSWDAAIPSHEYFSELRRVSVDQIIWGGNYFTDHLPPVASWAFWYKRTNGAFSDGELAWTSFGSPLKCFDYLWNGMLQGGPKEERFHPTQKPVALYRWLLKNYAKPGQRILDTHGGSMSIAIACDIEGFDLTLCEIDKDYFEAGKKRLAVHQSAPRLFEATPAGLPQQLELGGDVFSDGT